jgi:hypothetical protein
MMRIHLRIRPIKSLTDLHPNRVRYILSRLKGVEDIRIIDDRISGGMTITITMTLSDVSIGVLTNLEQMMFKLPKVKVNIMDKSGNETDLTTISAEDLTKFDIRYN